MPDNCGFHWERAAWGAALVCEPLLEVAPHLFTTRQLDLGTGDTDLRRGYEAVGQMLGLPALRLRDARQVHGTDVLVATTGADPGERPAADILMTADPGLGVTVRTADCVPILMADRRTGAVAAIHAGWRGTSAAAARRAVEAMGRAFGARPVDLVAAIGPSIGVCCYQVGEDVRTAFGHHAASFGVPYEPWFVADGERWRLDLWAANRDQLVAAGVAPDAVHLARECTASSLDCYYSFRVEGPRAGRLLAAIASRPRDRPDESYAAVRADARPGV